MIKKQPEPKNLNTCPICGKDVMQDAEHFPFCSDRCRLVDLGKWFSGSYKTSRPIEERDLDEDS